jgi:sugar phosphate isomerase/epimerase
MLYFSTGTFKGSPATKIAEEMYISGMTAVELSAGQHDPNFLSEIEKLRKLGLNLKLHNYYPVPSESFVMNLASPIEEIRFKSIALASQALEITSRFNMRHYAVHAGMRVDPNPSELGSQFLARDLVDEKISMNLFIESITSLTHLAKRLGVELLVENHVSNLQNLEVYGENVFLLSSLDQILSFYNEYGADNRLLLDVGHLKVSSNTLGFSKIEAFQTLHKRIGGYHLHDNDGVSDQHNAFGASAWFIPFLRNEVEYVTCEINDVSVNSITGVRKALSALGWDS